jgi:hypothetical protein
MSRQSAAEYKEDVEYTEDVEYNEDVGSVMSDEAGHQLVL